MGSNKENTKRHRIFQPNLLCFVLCYAFHVVRRGLVRDGTNSTPKWLNSRPKWRGWSGGAMVLGKLPVPGRSINFDYSRAKAFFAYRRCGLGCLDIFTLAIISLFFLPLSGMRPDID